MTRSIQSLLAVAVICVAGSFCFGQQVDNPQYKSWAKFKPGTSVTTKSDMDMGEMKTSTETTMTLIEVTPEKAVVETKMMMPGMDIPGTKMDIPAKVAQTTPPAGTTAPAVKETAEDVTIAGKTYKTKVMETKSSANGMDTATKSWTSEEVPGMMVKSETTMSGAMKGTTKTSITAITIK